MGPKARNVEDESPRNATTPCGSCGSAGRARPANVRVDAVTFQVIVRCSACGTAFAVLSRN
jgi:hypothetical protein